METARPVGVAASLCLGRWDHVKAGLEKEKAALLVIIGATVEGRKVLLACESGQRESKLSWAALLRDLKARGLKVPRLMIADGHLGIWSALGEILLESQDPECAGRPVEARAADG